MQQTREYLFFPNTDTLQVLSSTTRWVHLCLYLKSKTARLRCLLVDRLHVGDFCLQVDCKNAMS